MALGEGVAWVQPLSSSSRTVGEWSGCTPLRWDGCAPSSASWSTLTNSTAPWRGRPPLRGDARRAGLHGVGAPGDAARDGRLRTLSPKPPPSSSSSSHRAARAPALVEDRLPSPLEHQQQTVEWMLERTTARSSPSATRATSSSARHGGSTRRRSASSGTRRARATAPRSGGGVLQDQTGKTASVLRYLSCERTASPALLIVPSNLVSHWEGEMARVWDKTPNVVWLHTGSSLRSHTLQDLLSADVVVSTASFLRASKPYAEMAEAALGGGARSHAPCSGRGREPNHKEPLVEAVPVGERDGGRVPRPLREGGALPRPPPDGDDVAADHLPRVRPPPFPPPRPPLEKDAQSPSQPGLLRPRRHGAQERGGRLLIRRTWSTSSLATPTAEEVVRYSDTLGREVMVCVPPAQGRETTREKGKGERRGRRRRRGRAAHARGEAREEGPLPAQRREGAPPDDLPHARAALKRMRGGEGGTRRGGASNDATPRGRRGRGRARRRRGSSPSSRRATRRRSAGWEASSRPWSPSSSFPTKGRSCSSCRRSPSSAR